MKNENMLGRAPVAIGTRDAVHVAVIAMIAGEDLEPGTPVGIRGAGKVFKIERGNSIGVVDPFLWTIAHPGEVVWVCIEPGTITGMTHHWEHPDFTDAKASGIPDFVAEIAATCGKSVEALLQDCRGFVQTNENGWIMDNSERYKDVSSDDWSRLWDWMREEFNVDCKSRYIPYTCSC